MLTEFQAEVPYPLIHNLPELLPTRGVRAPTIRILLRVFIRQHGFKRPAMQIQVQHIFGRKSGSSQFRDEHFVDDAITLLPDLVGR
jgi:hypothetical protein